MKKPNILPALIFVIFGVGLSSTVASAQADTTASAGAANSEGIRAATVLTIHGTVTAVDKAEKLVTIQVPDGRKYTLKVDNPYNLDAANVGAGVVVRYYEVVSVRKKKAGESLPTLSVSGGVVTAKAGGVPGAVAEEHLNAVVSVVQVDKSSGTVTIKGADGSIETAKANNPKTLSHLKAGDDLVITTSRATAISLDKEPAK
jgi:preprotein translocase subunit YajC